MHRINLRSAWEAFDVGSNVPPARISLPLDWLAIPWPDGSPPATARLVRRFGRPPGSGPQAPPRLLLRGFVGVTSMELNGAPIAWCEVDGWHVVEPGELRPRNVLSILVDPTRAAEAQGPWGEAAFLECGDPGAGPLGLPEVRG